MSSDLFFYTYSDDEDEVNSELDMFTDARQAAYEGSKPKVQRTPVESDRYGAHDRLVMAYFSEHPQYDEATFREQNSKTKLDEVIPFEKQTDDHKKRLAKNNEAKMVIYNALPIKEYEIIFMCNTTKEICKTLLITHQGNSQVKDNKIDILVQQYEQFVISEDESIDSTFARFNTIITSFKALDEGYSSKNYEKKFLRALHSKWRAKVAVIKESKDLTSLSLDELIGNLKVHEIIIKKDSEIVKAKVERKSIALKAKKESSDEECSTTGSEDEESRDDKNGKSDRKCFRCGDPNHLIGECPKPPKDKNQRAFVGGSWSDSGVGDDEKVKDETCLVAHASSEICLGVDLEPDEWIKDSGCSKHMTGNQKPFSTYKAYNGGNVIFGSNLRGNIIGKGQICDNKCRVTFSEHDSEITKDGKVIGKQAHASHKVVVSTTRCLEILYMDLFGPSAVWSYGGNHYTLVIVDDYSSKAYIVLNKHTKKVEESLNVTFDETPPPFKTLPLVDDDLDEEEAIKVIETKNLDNDIVDETLEIDEIVNIMESRNNPLENVIGNLNQRTLRSQAQSIRTKWVFRNKLDENGIVSRNKARLVAQGYNQQEGIDYDETYAPGTDIETIVYADSDHAGDYVDRKSTSGPYQTNLPSPDDIISSIREDQEGQVIRIHHQEEVEVQDYQILTREIVSNLKPLEKIIQENVFCLGERKPRKDRGTRRGHHSTSSSTFNEPSSSHLNDDDDGNKMKMEIMKGPRVQVLLHPFCTSAIRQMTYGVVPDSMDEYLQMEFLRKPTYNDMEKLYAYHDEKHGFPEMPFVLLEAIASNDLWIWHAFFGVSGMNNDVNFLRQSPIFNDLKSGRAPDVPFVANNVLCKRGYYLTDGIYPQWSVLIKSIKNSGTHNHKRILYKTKHKAARKDVKRAFGVLKPKLKPIKYPARGMSQSRLSDVMYTCIILHNMIIHDNGNSISLDFFRGATL
nr:protein ALP1-like [Tanacetum cinerariifolium]